MILILSVVWTSHSRQQLPLFYSKHLPLKGTESGCLISEDSFGLRRAFSNALVKDLLTGNANSLGREELWVSCPRPCEAMP